MTPGASRGVTVTVKLGSGSLTATSDAAGAWSVAVPMAAGYLVEPSVALTVSAAKTGFMAPAEVVGTVIVDLTAPTASYTAPTSLQVGSAFTATATTSDSDIDSYAAAGLPAGLGINAGTGEIMGTPTAVTAAGTVTVTVIDRARNETEVTIAFPNVEKGDPDAQRFQLQPGLGDFWRRGADGDGADRGDHGVELFGDAAGGMHRGRQHGRADHRGGGRLRDHGHRQRLRRLQRGQRLHDGDRAAGGDRCR